MLNYERFPFVNIRDLRPFGFHVLMYKKNKIYCQRHDIGCFGLIQEVGKPLAYKRFFSLFIVNFRGIWKTAYFVSLCYIWSYVKYFGRFSFFCVYLLVKG
jgi:hypothetical protein